jgi:hypothetical protein
MEMPVIPVNRVVYIPNKKYQKKWRAKGKRRGARCR